MDWKKLKKLNLKQPKYVFPLILLPIALFLGYTLSQFFSAGPVDNKGVVKDSINMSLPEARGEAMEDKMGAMSKNFAEGGAFSAVDGIGDDVQQKDTTSSGYNQEEMEAIEREKAARLQQMKAEEELRNRQQANMNRINSYNSSGRSQQEDLNDYARELERIQNRSVERQNRYYADQQRREEEHCQRDSPVGHQHENERADDCDDTGKELQKELCETVADRVHVIDNAADEVAVRVGVDIRKRYGVELAEHRAAQVADGLVTNEVDKILHQPLKDRHAADRYADIAEDLRYVGKEHLSLTDDAVDRVTDEDRNIQRQRHADQRGNDRCQQQRKIGTQRTEYFFDRSICFHRAASFSVCWDRQMSR